MSEAPENTPIEKIKKISVTIDADGTRKGLMRFELRNNGDVILLLKHASFFREPGAPASDNKEIHQQRYSFHRSLESKEGINFIKQTFEFKDGEVINTRVVTPVIKNASGFVQIFSRRVPKLEPEKYNAKKPSKDSIDVNLGSWNMSNASLFLSVYVGSPSLDIPKFDGSANITSFVISDFRILLIWTYILMPAHDSGTLHHRMTFKFDDGSVIGQEYGVGVEKAVTQAFENFWMLAFEFAEILDSEIGYPKDIVSKMFELAGFSIGNEGCSPEVYAQTERLIASGKYNEYLSLLKKLR